ncbi:flagellar protein FliS [Lysinibacillus composti]|uniref:Flagellar secretion chaperone FliS n=1 Tax=Lysinibacillus composti TaxID=720633 RepID=A0A3N9UH34_9BACI|nr:flagellar export chaperone FliS [Lysinibacillus composti]MBM7607962.1 flagellar protein FliS [Lysinibacillus composti]RQW75424.1 flagella export chaperone FliS [Lysinibacillus composti]
MVAPNTAFNAYKQNSVTTASPGELTLMLYNGCLKFLLQAKKAIEAKDIEAKNTNLKKAQAIISELMVTLNMDLDVSKQMLPLYDYMNRRLIEANTKNDTDIIDEVMGLTTEFRDTWKQVIQVTRQQQFSNVQQV